MNEKKIQICSGHPKEEMPLIYTFAFTGAENWCPLCGLTFSMFGSGSEVEETKKLLSKLNKYKKLSKRFLKARSTLVCSETKYKGERIKPSDLPEKEKVRLGKIVDSWEYKYK